MEIEREVDGCTDIQSFDADAPLGDTNFRDLERDLDYAAHRMAEVSLGGWGELRRSATLRFHMKTEGALWVDDLPRSLVYTLRPGDPEPSAVITPPLPGSEAS
jgi:hypothetical protein